MKSLKNRILFSTLAIFLVGLWSLSFYISGLMQKDMERVLGDQQFSAASMVAAEVNRELVDRLGDLETVAQKITPALLANTPALQTLLGEHPIFQKQFNGGTYTTRKDGTATASVPLSLGRAGVNYIDRDHVARALQQGEASISELVIGKRLNAPVFSMAVPIRDAQGAVIGVLVGVIDLGEPNFLDRITTGNYGRTGGYVLISARERLVIMATDKRRVMEALPPVGVNPVIDRFIAGYEGSALMVNPAGIQILAADKAIPVAGWIASAVLPTEEAFAPVRATQRRLLLGSTLLTLLAGGFGLWILRRHLTPLLSTAQAVAVMAQPNATLQPLPVARRDEVGALVGGVNRLIETIGQRELALRESDQTLRLILETTLDGYWRVSAQGELLDVNLAYIHMSGYTREELLDMCISDLEAVEQSDETRQHVERIKREGHDQFESTHRRKDGSTWFVEVSTVFDPHQGGQLVAFLRDISERKRDAQTLAANEKRLSLILEGAVDAIYITDTSGNYLYVNQAATTLLGYSREEMLSKNIREIAQPEDLNRAQAQFATLLSTGALRADYWLRNKSGDSVPVELNATLLPDGSVYGACRDITERKQAEKRLQLAASVFTYAREGIMITAADGSVIDVNDTFTRITGYSREEVLGKNPRFLSSGRQNKSFYADLWSHLETQGYWSGEVWNRRKNGEVFAEMQTISAVRDAQGKVQSYLALFSDITSLKENQYKLEHIAHFDALTNLPNRVLLADRLHQSMAQALRRNHRLAIAYLDLDGFKGINDHHGHEAGDRLLIALAGNLKQVLRDGDTLARMGGDEFVAVLVDLEKASDSAPVLDRLLAAAAQPVVLDGQTLQVSASLGVTFYPQEEPVDAEQLLRQADQAMYQAKQAGKHRYHLFDADQDRALRGHHEGLHHIREAMARQEFVLYYQPKVDMRQGVVIGAEALIRWQHPTQGLLPPAQFLPLIEEDKLSVELGEWVIDTALSQIEAWHAAGVSIPVSVNVGARQLQQPNFLERLRAQLASHPAVKPGDLELELLETSALEDMASISKLIEDCRGLGVTFALDDFGTGYSSLTYLKRLPVTLLKIDQGFVRDMLDDPDDLAILDGVIGLSEAFRREVIAEGVETVMHGEVLLRMGCDQAQGYGIARPMPAHALPAWKELWQPDPSWSQVPKIDRSDLPLLVARVELRAWSKAMENYVKGERTQPPTLDHQNCPFGRWLSNHGTQRYGARADFAVLDALHRPLHGQAAQMYALKTQGKDADALASLVTLHGMTAALMAPLNRLIQNTKG